MKNSLVIIILSFFITTQSFSQSNYKIKLSGGLTFPIEPNSFKIYWNEGINLSTSFGVKVKENLFFDINFEYYNFSFKSDEFIKDYESITKNIQNIKNSIQVFSFYPSLNVYFKNYESQIYPFIYIGLGWMNYSTDEIEVNFISQSAKLNGVSKSLLILLGGIGLNYEINNNFTVFIETNYRYGSIDNDRVDILPMKLGAQIKF